MINARKFTEVHIEIEDKCPLDCLHCSSAILRSVGGISFKTPEIIALLKNLNTELHVYLTGGEPFLHYNLAALIKTITCQINNVSVGIFTSGVGKGKKPISLSDAQSLKYSGLSDCYVSLYHNTPKLHDLITGMPGSYEITCESICNLIRSGIDVKAHVVMTRYNYSDYEQIIFRILDLGISQVRVLRIVNTGNANSNWNEIGVSYATQDSIVRKIISNISSYGSKVTVSGFPAEIECRPFSLSQKCQAGITLLYISGDGNVYPCACTKNFEKFRIGHIFAPDNVAEFIDNKEEFFNNDCLNPVS